MPMGGTQLGSGHSLVSALTNSSRNIASVELTSFFCSFFIISRCSFVNLNIL